MISRHFPDPLVIGPGAGPNLGQRHINRYPLRCSGPGRGAAEKNTTAKTAQRNSRRIAAQSVFPFGFILWRRGRGAFALKSIGPFGFMDFVVYNLCGKISMPSPARPCRRAARTAASAPSTDRFPNTGR